MTVMIGFDSLIGWIIYVHQKPNATFKQMTLEGKQHLYFMGSPQRGWRPADVMTRQGDLSYLLSYEQCL